MRTVERAASSALRTARRSMARAHRHRGLASAVPHPMEKTWAKRDMIRDVRASPALSSKLELTQEMTQSFELSAKDLTTLLGAISNDGHAATAEDLAKAVPVVGDLVERIRSSGMDGLAYAISIRSLAATGASSAALSLLDEALDAGESLSPALPAFAFEGAFHACAAGGDAGAPVADQVCTLLDRMVAAAIPRDSSTYAAAISACSHGGNSEGALAILDRMTKENIWPTAETLANVASLLATESKWDEVRQVYTHMHALKLVVPAETYALFLSGCIEQNRTDEAADVFLAYRSRGYEPTEEVRRAHVAVALASRCGGVRCGRWRGTRSMSSCSLSPCAPHVPPPDVHVPHAVLRRRQAATLRGRPRGLLSHARAGAAVRHGVRARDARVPRGRHARRSAHSRHRAVSTR
jgi:pentatricopeptide repeat protein